MLEEYNIISCKPHSNYRLELVFADGKSGIVDLSHLAHKGVFTLWDDYSEFKKVSINPISGTICWGDRIDLDPIVLKNQISSDSH